MKRSAYREQDYSFGQIMLTLRSAIGLTQAELAAHLAVSRQSIAEWEAGRKYPSAKNLQSFIALTMQRQAFSEGRETDEIRQLWKAAHQKVLLDESWLAALFTPPTIREADAIVQPPPVQRQHVDWDDAISVHNFFGREAELDLLAGWVIAERCQVVTLLGLGGIGKSALAVQLMQQQAHHFDSVIWRSLRDTPTDDEFFTDLIQAIAPQSLNEAHTSLERRQAVLFDQLRNNRVLLVLDNLESMLGEGEYSGTLMAGHEGFGRFLRQAAETRHQSCILLTSREKPKDLTPFEGNQSPVRAIRLAQLDTKACEALLSEKGIVGSSADYTRLIAAYTGNPLALKIVAQTITDLFASEVAPFLEQGEVIFGGIRELLTAQFNRLSALEQTVLMWLAILREPSTINEILAVMVRPEQRFQLLEVFETLYRRSLVERGHRQGSFTLQSVVLEFATVHLIAELSAEILAERFSRFIDHGIELTQVREYVRQTQERLITAPIVAKLNSTLPRHISVEAKLAALLDHFRGQPESLQGYAPANVAALLRLSRGNLRGVDLSNLMLRGISLQGVEMQDASLAGALVVDSVFTETFDEMIAVAISQNGGYWAASSRRGEVRIWSDHGLNLHRAWRAHMDMIMALAFSSDGQLMATGSWDRSVKVWHVETGDLLWTGWHTGELVRVAFSPDDRLLASTGGTEIMLWEVQNGSVFDNLPHGITPAGAVWSSDGRLLVTSDINGILSIWSPTVAGKTTRLGLIDAGPIPVSGLAFSPDDKVIASSGNDTVIKLWDVESGVLLDTLEGHTDRTRRVIWSPDGRTIASASRDQTIWLWDAETRTCRIVLQGHFGEVWSIAFSADSQHLLSSSADGTLRVWDTVTGRCIRVIQSYATPMFDIAWSPDSGRLVSGGANTAITIWDLADDSPAQVLSDTSTIICSLGWSLDGQSIASSEGDHAVRLWNAVTWNPPATLQPPDDNGHIFYNLAWSPDGQQLAWGTFKHGIAIFDVQTGSYRYTSQDFMTRLRHVGWSPDGRYVAGCGYNSIIYVWDSQDLRLIQHITGHSGMIMCLAWNADSVRLMAGGVNSEGGELTVWDVRLGESLYAISQIDHAVSAAAWDVDDETLITGGSDGKVRWWDLKQAAMVDVRSGHEGMIQSLRTSPDKTAIATCGNDGAIMLWDTNSRKHLRTLRHDRPYERLDITGIKGFTDDEKAILRGLGAIERS